MSRTRPARRGGQASGAIGTPTRELEVRLRQWPATKEPGSSQQGVYNSTSWGFQGPGSGMAAWPAAAEFNDAGPVLACPAAFFERGLQWAEEVPTRKSPGGSGPGLTASELTWAAGACRLYINVNIVRAF